MLRALCLLLPAGALVASHLAPAAHAAAPIFPHAVMVQPGETAVDAFHRAARQARLEAHAGYRAPPDGIVHPAPPGTAPAIISGSIATTPVNVTAPPTAPTSTFSFEAANGINIVLLEFTSPHGQILDTYYSPNPVDFQTKGTITFQDFVDVLNLYAEPGSWTLTYAEIFDDTYAATTYTAAQLAAIFPQNTMTVVNTGTPDFTPPVVTAGKILTPVVHLATPSPAHFKTRMTVSDDVSGVYQPFILIEPSGNQSEYTPETLPAPLMGGTIVDTDQIYGPAGVWYIVGYGASDAAGNLFLDQTDADIVNLFGTDMFKVDE